MSKLVSVAHPAILLTRPDPLGPTNITTVDISVSPKNWFSQVQSAVQGWVEQVNMHHLKLAPREALNVYANEEGAINGKWPVPTCVIPTVNGMTPLFGPVVIMRPLAAHKRLEGIKPDVMSRFYLMDGLARYQGIAVPKLGIQTT